MQFETEEQQVEAIKRFWREHGKAILLGAVLGLGGLWGWRYYSEQQLLNKEQASLAFAQVFENTDEHSVDAALAMAAAHAGSGYAPLARLLAVQQMIEAEDYAQAITTLEAVRRDVKEPVLSAVSSLRLARLYLHTQQPEQALTVLAAVKADAFAGQVQALQGDAYVMLNRADDARQAYLAAVAVMPNNRLVKMKLDNLATTMMPRASEE